MTARPRQINNLTETIRLVEDYAQKNNFINYSQFNGNLAKKSLVVPKTLFEDALDSSKLCAFEPVSGRHTTGWVIHEAKAVGMDTNDDDSVMDDDLGHYYDNSQPGPDDVEKHGEPIGQQAECNSDGEITDGEPGHSTPSNKGMEKTGKDIDLKDKVDTRWADKPYSWNLSNNLGSVVKESAVAGGIAELRSNYKVLSEGVREAIDNEFSRLPNPPKETNVRFVVESANERIAVKEPYRALMIAEELKSIGRAKKVNISIIAEGNGTIVRGSYEVPNLKARLPLFLEGKYLFANRVLAEEFADAATKINQTSKLSNHKYGTMVANTMSLSEATDVLKNMKVI